MAHRVIAAADLLAVACMQLAVGHPLDLRWSLVQNVGRVLRVLRLELVEDTALVDWKTMLVEL